MEVAPTSSLAEEERFVYVIRESHELPQIDCFRALKHVLLSEQRAQICSRWLSHHKQWLAMFFVIGIVNASITPLVPAKPGRAVVFFGLAQLPNIFAAIISLRYDMIRLILTTYEFRYFTCLNLTFSMALAANFQDLRSLSFVPSLFSLELLALQDANFRALRFTILIFCYVAMTQVLFIVYVNLDLIDQWCSVEVFRYGKHAITADNIMSNYLVFTTVILLRNAYRKHRWVRDCNGGETTVVRCIVYRCRVRLCLHNALEAIRPLYLLNEKTAQMRLVPCNQLYDSNRTVLQACSYRVRRLFAQSQWNRIGLYVIGAIGSALTYAALLYEPDHTSNDDLTMLAVLSISSAIVSGLFCGTFWCLYQRQLLIKLLTSFDFIFFSTNISIVHVCISDASAWTPKCFAILSSWIWIMWAITTDALTPDMRQALGLRRLHLIGVITMFVLLVVLLVVDLIFVHRWNLQDRSLFQVQAHGKMIHMHVFQLFFSSLISALPMCFRILWRLHTARCDELILIQGAVEYDDIILSRRRKRHHAHLITQRSKTRSRSMLTLIHPTPPQSEGSISSLFPRQVGISSIT